jgi:hypothetical protein
MWGGSVYAVALHDYDVGLCIGGLVLMSIKKIVKFEKEYQFRHSDGKYSTIKQYKVTLDGKEYGVEIGNGEPCSKNGERAYVYSRGRLCKHDGVISTWVEAHCRLTIQFNDVQ